MSYSVGVTRLIALTIVAILGAGSGIQGFCRYFCVPAAAVDTGSCHHPVAGGDGDTIAPANSHTCDFPAVPAGVAGTVREHAKVLGVAAAFPQVIESRPRAAAIAALRESPPDTALAPPFVLRI